MAAGAPCGIGGGGEDAGADEWWADRRAGGQPLLAGRCARGWARGRGHRWLRAMGRKTCGWTQAP